MDKFESMRAFTQVVEDRFVDPITEGYDLNMRIGAIPQSPNLVVNQIKILPRFICAAPSYLKAQGIPQYPSDLKHHHCLHYGYLTSGCNWLLIKGGNQEKIRINPVFCANNGEVLRDAAIQGLGIVMLPDFILNSALERGELQIILPDYKPVGLNLSIFYPLNRHLSAKVQLFTQFIQESFA